MKSKYEYAKSKEYGEYLNRPDVIREVRKSCNKIKGYNKKRRGQRDKYKIQFTG